MDANANPFAMNFPSSKTSRSALKVTLRNIKVFLLLITKPGWTPLQWMKSDLFLLIPGNADRV